MGGRRGITVLSDVVILLALTFLIATLWVYAAENFRSKHTLEAESALPARELYSAAASALDEPGSCNTLSVVIPKGVRIYIMNVELNGTQALAITVRSSGARLDYEAVRNFLVKYGVPRNNSLILIRPGEGPEGAAALLRGTVALNLTPVQLQLASDGKALLPQDFDWGNRTYTVFFNYKMTRVQVCSSWDNSLHLTTLKIIGG
ncbi:MAG: hypothetical protein F7C35_08815 [Desulfurococcales archaeon]|nr:hypothetical protein [Desulfurococcales archaeon]